MLNEMSTLIIQSNTGKQLLMRQIAGAMARRVITFINENEYAKAGDTIGVIRFGSRVDLLLPIDTELYVNLGDKVKGGWTQLGKLKY
ncbi:MAG TPA: phosphatidylserine decarboxylase, partial [Bacteroidales bacterium]|jgi:phosphatidylserine decarboxylase|nr:phosphatidylserine decarboxylase [Bacteroidales bacterium]